MLKIRRCKTYAEAIACAAKNAASFTKDPRERLFAFCEDKLTMSLETEIAKACGGGTFNVTVTTFSRFIHTFSDAGQLIDKQSSVMIVRRILAKLNEKAGVFAKSASNAGTSVTLYELIAQLKSANVTYEQLLRGAESADGALKRKLSDIAFVYREYEDHIRERMLYDSNSYLALMPGILKSGFEGASAMLVGYGSLTKQGLDVAKALAKNMKNLSVFLLDGDNKELYTGELKASLMREIGGFCVEESDFTYSAERRKIMETLFEPTAFSRGGRVETGNIFVFEAKDREEEIERIAAIIRRKAIGGMRYREIAVAVGEPSAASDIFARVFGDYGIPYFLDDPKKLSEHPVSRLALAYLDMLRRGLTPETALAMEKNPYFQPSKEEADLFEQFLKEFAVTPAGLKNGLNPTLSGNFKGAEGFEIFERERTRLLKNIKEADACADYAELLKQLFSECGVEELAAKNALELRRRGAVVEAAFTEQAFAKITSVIDSLYSVLGDVPMKATEFRAVLFAGLSSCEISVLPQLADAVYVGDFKECKYLEHKILFAAGLNGDVPFTKSDTALLTDRDLTRMEGFDVAVEPKIKVVNRRERENVGAALLSFSQRLYLSRVAVGADGNAAPKGRILDYFAACFTRGGKELCPLTSAQLAARARSEGFSAALDSLEYSAVKPASLKFLYKAADFREGVTDDFSKETAILEALKEISPERAEALKGCLAAADTAMANSLEGAGEMILRRDTISATVLETYFNCPFACFAKYALRIGESADANVGSNEYGNFLHGVLEDFVGALIEDYKRPEGERKITRETIEGVVSEIFAARCALPEFSKYIANKRLAAMFKVVEREAIRVASEIYAGYENSAFRPAETEIKFKEGGKRPPVRLKTPFGEKLLTGKIDRVDKYRDPASGRDYVRIIDYKTFSAKFDEEELYTGNKLQLFLYLAAVLGEGEIPAGAYYFPVVDKFSEDGDFIYSFSGKTLKEKSVLTATDLALGGGAASSAVLQSAFKGDLEPKNNKSSFLTAEEMQAYLRYAVLISERGAQEICEGIIRPSPYENKCENCNFKTACAFEGGARKESGAAAIREAILGVNGNE